MDITAIRNEMLNEARNAANKFFQEKLNGQDAYACGFSWITIVPKNKGNTKLGREERKMYADLGFKKDYTGKNYQYWNPSGHMCQNVDTKYAGSRAGAEVLKKYGINAYAEDRLD